MSAERIQLTGEEIILASLPENIQIRVKDDPAGIKKRDDYQIIPSILDLG